MTNSFLQKIFLPNNNLRNVGQNEQQISETCNRNMDLGGTIWVAEVDIGLQMTEIDTQKRHNVFDWCFRLPGQSISPPKLTPKLIVRKKAHAQNQHIYMY